MGIGENLHSLFYLYPRAGMKTEALLAAAYELSAQLHADAMENAPLIKPLEIKGMSEIMAEMIGAEQAAMMGIAPVAPEDEKIFVATVPDKVHGASVLAY